MLLIDVGNSRIKWAVWKNNQMMDYSVFVYCEDNLQQLLLQNLEAVPKQKVFVCSVASSQVNQIITKWIKSCWQINVEFVEAQRQQLGVVNAYHKANALGVDRWLGILAAYQRYKKAVCVIDCGTAVTLDVVDETGQHLGGLIMPGMRMMQQSLLMGTQRIDSVQGEVSMLANNTEDAVMGGCRHLLESGLQGLYKKYCEQLGTDLLCVVTGGDGENVAKAMDINCHYEEDLILYGLQLVAQSRD